MPARQGQRRTSREGTACYSVKPRLAGGHLLASDSLRHISHDGSHLRPRSIPYNVSQRTRTGTVNIRLYALQLYVTCYITGRIAIDNFHGNHRQISRSSSGMQPRQGELEKRDGFVAHCTHRCEHTVIRPSTDDADNRPGPHRRRRHRHRLHRLLPHSGCPAT